MNWSVADYVILSASAIAGVAGLFIGFSGAAAFLAATVIGALSGRVVWSLSANFLETSWTRGLATAVVTLLIFGFSRWAVRRIVNGLLKQPADSCFGFLVSAITGIVLSTLAAYLIGHFHIAEIRSVFVSEISAFL